jgi:hypothetical protein
MPFFDQVVVLFMDIHSSIAGVERQKILGVLRICSRRYYILPGLLQALGGLL